MEEVRVYGAQRHSKGDRESASKLKGLLVRPEVLPQGRGPGSRGASDESPRRRPRLRLLSLLPHRIFGPLTVPPYMLCTAE